MSMTTMRAAVLERHEAPFRLSSIARPAADAALRGTAVKGASNAGNRTP